MTHQYWFCNFLQNSAGILGYTFNFVSNNSSPYVWRKLNNTVRGRKGTPYLQGKVIYFAPCYSHKSVFYLTGSLDKGSMMYMCVCNMLYKLFILDFCKTRAKSLSPHWQRPCFLKTVASMRWKPLSVGSSHAIVRADPNFSLCCYGNKRRKISVWIFSLGEKEGG